MKFSDALARFLYVLSLGGTDDEMGDVDINGRWYGLLLSVDPLAIELTDEERRLFGTDEPRHFIVSEDDQGFFSYEIYDTENDALNAWDDISMEISEDRLDIDDAEDEW